ncbi:topoisomerase DNA-binding C4 zinc finger domain-containing protein [Vibrio ostreicida]|uniref:Topoisomerase DNA-binding C4 zinc finger domain-containing protein n=1 Tax=Vibrio ostreicida TaxID=526588 RepID=A0ABT8BQ73_9VIBR|nr:topoisomerase DNA-binding C4 zinc finger domain-containing protein [Vibrio ostreicida]MDN3608586.1 topoisomerase DNA-binding C4 zinc finger domain-containing protein [Vibrio ostreicida]NPD10981.1 DNA topoisomerase [Vibrio ostreicida]
MSGKIDHQLFTAHEHALELKACPKCQAEQRLGVLQLRHSKRGSFLGCTLYPSCDFIQPLNQNDGHIVKELGVPCPMCSHELVLRQGRYGMFIGCSDYPQCQHIESLEAERKPETGSLIECPECRQGQLVERKSRIGKTFFACDHYPKCKFSINQVPIKATCEKCGFPLLTEKKFVNGTKRQCGDRKCHHIQSE